MDSVTGRIKEARKMGGRVLFCVFFSLSNKKEERTPFIFYFFFPPQLLFFF